MPQPVLESAACVVFLGACDGLMRILIRRAPRPPRKEATVRWFGVHALANYAISALSAPWILMVLRDPLASLSVPSSSVGICLAIWLHLYHMAFYRLTPADLWHHGIFLPLIGFPGYAAGAWGPLREVQLTWLCGVPGAVTYTVLAAQRMGYLTRVDEPSLTAVLNVGLRCPGTLAANLVMTYIVATSRPYAAPLWAIALQLVLAPTNAVGYAWQSVCRARKRAGGTDERPDEPRGAPGLRCPGCTGAKVGVEQDPPSIPHFATKEVLGKAV